VTIAEWYRQLFEKSDKQNKELKEKLEKIFELVDACMVCESQGCNDCDLLRRIRQLAEKDPK
jgi:hypothetical protein